MDQLAVVILNYNGAHYLRQFLNTFITYCQPYPIYVADNASTDNSVEIVTHEYPTVNLINLTTNLGYAGGYNAALSQIEAKYYAIVNSDIEVTDNWLEPLISFLNDNEDCAAIQPKIKSFQNKKLFEYAGGAGGYLDALGYPYCRGRIFDHLESDQGQYDNLQEVFWTSGACFVIRSESFHEANGFDPDFFAHMEEIDLCWRLQRAGWKFYCQPESIVYHIGGGTLSSINPQKTYLNFKNGLSLLTKNIPLSQIYKLPVRLFLDWIAAAKFTLEGSTNHALAVFRAHSQFVIGIVRDLKKRKGPYHRVTKNQKKYVRSIVWERYINQKKKFSDL